MATSRKAVGIFCSAAIVAICALVLTIGTVSAADIIFVGPSETYTEIQQAVAIANPFDTIIVRDSTYFGNIVVTVDNVTIRSENGSANCFVAPLVNNHVFNVTADWVTISGFTVFAAGTGKAGIYLNNADHCTISENTASYNDYGIYLYYSSSNTLTNNAALDNNNGICLSYSGSNNLTGNTANSNDYDGIYLHASSSNTLTDNTANYNDHYGIFLDTSSNNNTLTDNTANLNTPYGIFLVSSSNNNLTNNTANSNIEIGIYLYASSNNNLTGNTANSNNHYGIALYMSSSNNLIMGNTANLNGWHGIFLRSSSNNLIYNNYFNNTNNARDDGTNIWNITRTQGTNIIGGSLIGGNYWSDYTGNDTDGDGFGDTPYDIPGGTNKDYLPLVAIAAPHIFDTGKGDYPSIMGTHNGTIKPNQTITVSKLYTYPCVGTGGHTEYVKIWNATWVGVEAYWDGYQGDWHNITLPEITLVAGETYNYTIRTGSYPQILHESSWKAIGGVITCTDFVDINGKRHEGWIPAIRLS